MKGKRYSGYIVGAVLLLIGIYLVVTFNGLVKKEEKYKLQWMKYRMLTSAVWNLIPNLVNIVKRGTEYEQTTLQKISDARAKAMSLNVSDEINAENFSGKQPLRINWRQLPIGL